MNALRDWTIVQHHPDGRKIPRLSFDSQEQAERTCEEMNNDRDSTELAFFVVADTTNPIPIVASQTFNEPPC